MTRKKIILFIDSLNSGGAQRQIVGLASSVDRNRYDPVVLTYHDIPHFKPVLDEAGVRVECIPKHGKFDIGFLFRLARFFHRERPDILLSYLNTPNMWARLAGRIAGVKKIITSERNINIVHSWMRMFIERLLKGWGSAVVVNATVTRELLHSRLGVPEEKIHIIYNGIDVDSFNNPDPETVKRLRNEFALTEGEQVIMLPGRIQEQKNHICLVKAFCQIRKFHEKVRLLLVGEAIDKSIKSRLEDELARLNCQASVIFAGQRTEMPELYFISDIVVLPSLWEGFPNVVMEAMAAQRPVVASDIVDNRLLVKEGVTGHLFASDNCEQLAEQLESLISLPAKRLDEMGMAGKELVEKEYAMPRMVEKYQTLFECIMHKK